MSYKVVVLKANGDVEKYPFESGASVSDIKNLLKSDNIETARGRDYRLTEMFEFDMYYDVNAKTNGKPVNSMATYCFNEYLSSVEPRKLFKQEIHGDVAFERKT